MFFLLKNWSSNISVFFVTSFVFLNTTQYFLCSSLPLSKLSQWHLNHCTWMVHFIILASQISSPRIKEVIYFTFLSGIQKVREEDPCFEFRPFHATFWDLPILQGCLFYYFFCFWDNGSLCDFELVIILIQAPVLSLYCNRETSSVFPDPLYKDKFGRWKGASCTLHCPCIYSSKASLHPAPIPWCLSCPASNSVQNWGAQLRCMTEWQLQATCILKFHFADS